MKTPTKQQLIKAIEAANSRFLKGLNDDDQVFKMHAIANNLKGYYFLTVCDLYTICTDFERLSWLSNSFGYWSEQVKSFNTVLINKGGINYSRQLNEEYLQSIKQHDKTRIKPQTELF